MVPALYQYAVAPIRRRRDRQIAVARNRMVHSRDHGQATLLQFQQSVAEALIVVNNVVSAAMFGKIFYQSPPESVGLTKPASEHGPPLVGVSERFKVVPAQCADVIR